MANKIITELQLISALTDECNLPTDNTIQTYRTTIVQVYQYIRSSLEKIRTFTTNTSILSTDRIILLNAAGGSFTQDLPACASFPIGTVKFKVISAADETQAVTLDADGAEPIDFAETLVLNSYPFGDSVTLFNTGTKWVTI